MAVSSYQSKDRGSIRSLRMRRTSRQVWKTESQGHTGFDREKDSEDTAGCGRTEIMVERVDTERKRDVDSKKDNEDRDMSGHRSVKGGKKVWGRRGHRHGGLRG